MHNFRKENFESVKLFGTEQILNYMLFIDKEYDEVYLNRLEIVY